MRFAILLWLYSTYIYEEHFEAPSTMPAPDSERRLLTQKGKLGGC